MTVQQLIDKLKEFPLDAPVRYDDDGREIEVTRVEKLASFSGVGAWVSLS
jgi:hypothetical protein